MAVAVHRARRTRILRPDLHVARVGGAGWSPAMTTSVFVACRIKHADHAVCGGCPQTARKPLSRAEEGRQTAYHSIEWQSAYQMWALTRDVTGCSGAKSPDRNADTHRLVAQIRWPRYRLRYRCLAKQEAGLRCRLQKSARGP